MGDRVKAVDCPVLTVGYGGRELFELLDLLVRHDVEYVVDVRSYPSSRYKPQFSRAPLSKELASKGVRYVFMGLELGGRPDDPSCYDADGHVDYEQCRERPVFVRAVERLVSGWRDGHRIAVLCSEGKPEECHRTKLVAEALIEQGVDVEHIDVDDELVSHAEVMSRIVDPQLSLLSAGTTATKSRRAYR